MSRTSETIAGEKAETLIGGAGAGPATNRLIFGRAVHRGMGMPIVNRHTLRLGAVRNWFTAINFARRAPHLGGAKETYENDN